MKICDFSAEYPEFGFLWAWPKFVNLQMTDAEKQSFIAAAGQSMNLRSKDRDLKILRSNFFSEIV